MKNGDCSVKLKNDENTINTHKRWSSNVPLCSKNLFHKSYGLQKWWIKYINCQIPFIFFACNKNKHHAVSGAIFATVEDFQWITLKAYCFRSYTIFMMLFCHLGANLSAFTFIIWKIEGNILHTLFHIIKVKGERFFIYIDFLYSKKRKSVIWGLNKIPVTKWWQNFYYNVTVYQEKGEEK